MAAEYEEIGLSIINGTTLKYSAVFFIISLNFPSNDFA